MSRYEITYGEHDIFTTETGREPTMQRQFGAPWRSPEYPAGVSWQEAHDYCAWLGEQSGLPFALPTEAQWEYAARSRGKVVPFATDTGLIEPGVNYPPSTRYPFPVGNFPPNPLGFYDMSGNVQEWVADWYDPAYYSKSPEHNPQGPETGTEKVYRGGGSK
ncbi:formylglycine-generating enzyme family protein [Geoalkalibacter ferrihydriticus]|uniref:formylglycine-generating enzyme family protein n=1 Tax=Geoalkalibacter ferrihydriticus TaxID=392333 RepID=UPI000694650D|nr:SUMF1/EgtB/PvdO family nonheme iron enzyme [Geoalkalibacter ferrihydriticus]